MKTNESNSCRKYRIHPFFGFLLVLASRIMMFKINDYDAQLLVPDLPIWLKLTIMIPFFLANITVSIMMIEDYIDNLDNNFFLTKWIIFCLVINCFFIGFDIVISLLCF